MTSKRPPENLKDGPSAFTNTSLFFLQTYTNDDIIAETVNDIVRFKQPRGFSLLELTDLLRMKTLRCLHGHDDYVLKVKLVKSLSHSIHHHTIAKPETVPDIHQP